MAPLGRRAFLGAALSLAAPGTARADPKKKDAPVAAPVDFEVRDFTVDGDRFLGNRFTLCVPKHLAKDEKVPLLVALHGAGETVDQRTGAWAFVERYGLASAYERLRRPPVARTLAKLDYFTDAKLAELNQSLTKQPFKGIAIACPFMPNVLHVDRVEQVLDKYASWIAEVVLPRARKEAPVHQDAAHTSLDGVSLGGYVGIEVLLRKPDLFGAWGCVQGALGAFRIQRYADKLSALLAKTPKDLHLETSDGDPFHDDTVKLAGLLSKKGIANELLVYPGPHDQPFLRESGTIGMLRWHDKRKR